MLQFEVRTTVNLYDEDTKKRHKDFDYSKELIERAKETLERTLNSTFFTDDLDNVFVLTIAGIKEV